MDILSRNQKSLLAGWVLLGHLLGQLMLPFSAWGDTLRPTIEGKAAAGVEQALQTAGSEELLRGSDQLRMEEYQNIPKPEEETRSDRDWFLAKASPLSDWTLEMVYHPDDISHCAFGHGIRWAFNYVHSPTRQRIVLGQDEIVSFGLMPSREHEWLIRLFQRAGLPTAASAVSLAAVKRALVHDKKFTQGRMRWVLPTRIGRVVVSDGVPPADVWRLARRYVSP